MAFPAILQQLNRNGIMQMIQPVKQMMNTVRMAQNPQAALNQLAMSNPQMKQVMDIISRHGGDPMTALREEAAAAGIDVNEIMGYLNDGNITRAQWPGGRW